VLTALPITYDEPEPEKKSWFSSRTWPLHQDLFYLRESITLDHERYLQLWARCGHRKPYYPQLIGRWRERQPTAMSCRRRRSAASTIRCAVR
jgi:hypothetical protein